MPAFLVNTSPKFVFIHVPKCGGTSIREGFFGSVPKEIRYSIPDNWAKLWSFATVRNPYKRIVSAYKMFHFGIEKTVSKKRKILVDYSFEKFMDLVTGECDYKTILNEDIDCKIKLHTRRMVDPFSLLDKAKYITKLEDIDENWPYICSQIGVDYKPLKKTHTTIKTESPICDKTLQMINDYYEDDFRQFNYDRVNKKEDCPL